MTKVIVITSGKGGVGKTTSAINLAAAMCYFGKKVLVVDANLTTPNVGIHLGCPEAPVSLNHVLSNKADLSEAIYEHESGIRIIPSSLSVKELKKIKSEKLKDLKKDLKKVADIVIIDSAAGLGEEAFSAIDIADELIVITNPEIPAITDALKAIKVAESMKKDVLGVIMTKVRKDKIEMQPDNVREILEVPILGMIPHDMDVKRSLNLKSPVVNTHPKSNPSRAYKEIAAKILDIEYDSNEDKESLLERLFRKIKRNRD
ncbi:MAG: cell division ATPase MinD [Candidatus Pacearchaeota archaeon]